MKSSLLNRIIMIVLACLSGGVDYSARAELKTGDKFPDLTGFKLDGRLPEAVKGKIIIVDFWASWCGPCAQSFPVLEEINRRYKDQGVVIIAISVDEQPAKMEKFLKQHPVAFSVVRDAEQKLVAMANVDTMPSSFILDADGKIRYLHNGFHGEETKKQYVNEIESLLKAKP